MGSFQAELLLLRKYSAYWVLLAIACAITVLLGYALPYLSYRGKAAADRRPADLADLLPGHVIASTLSALPFWFGMLALILGVLMFGGEYGWGTLKTTLMQQPSRARVCMARLAAMALALLLTWIAVVALAVACSLPIALAEGSTLSLPSAWDLLRGVGAGWLILAVWAVFGATLAVAARGTALAVGLGILYALVFEGLVSGYRQNISLLNGVAHAFLRTNAFSLVSPLGAKDTGGGPGSFSGPFVDAWQALVVMIVYLIALSGVMAVIVRRRDVT
jgi:ABC-type transport system involved in multi-copper enzyme maturation permease subunit